MIIYYLSKNKNVETTENLFKSINNNLSSNIYLSALDSISSGIIITDNSLYDNPIIYCNAGFEKMTGYIHNEIVGHNCRFLQGEDRGQPERYQLKEAIQSGTKSKVEIKNYKKDGSMFWNEIFVSPIFNADGVITHFISMLNDVSERRRNEQKLQKDIESLKKKKLHQTIELNDKKAFLSSILRTLRESLLVLDSNFKVLNANEQFLHTFKICSEDIIGKVLFDIGNNQWNRAHLKNLLVKHLSDDSSITDLEITSDFPYLGNKSILINAYRIELEDHNNDQTLVVIKDISELKEIERRKNDFLSNASHELNTPFTAIKDLVQLLQKKVSNTSSSNQYIPTLDKVSLYINRLNIQISELLKPTKTSSDRKAIFNERFEIDTMIHDIVENYTLTVPTHEITLRGETRAFIFGDQLQISRVISNLISNAIKFSPKCSIIKVDCKRIGEFAKISVQDFGIGIRIQDQSNIFKRFFRADDIQKKYPGIGIGLHMCYESVTKHNGTLWVESEIGSGSTFSFTLPIMNLYDHGKK